jgi:transcription factor S
MNQQSEDQENASKLGDVTSKRGVTFCPKCGSTDVFWASGLPQLWSVWECRNCGYRGSFIVKDGKLAEKLRADYKKKAT